MLDLSLSPQQRLELKISPQMIVSLKMLEIPMLELEQLLKQAIEENPLLEEEIEASPEETKEEEPREEPVERANGDPEGQEDIIGAGEQEAKTGADEIDWDLYFQDGGAHEYEYYQQHEKDENQDLRDREGRSGTTLGDHLLAQFYLLELSERDREIGEYIIGNLEDDGLLSGTVEEIAGVFHVDSGAVERVLKQVQTLDPVGVGARDLRECLMIQLKAAGREDSLAMRLLRDHWEDVKNRRLAAIKKALKARAMDIQDALEEIAGLNPKPGLSVGADSAIPIIPDLLVEYVDGEYIVMLNDRHMPRLRVSRAYQTILNRKSDASSETKQYVRKKLKDAHWLVSSIEQRRSTMLKVMNYIVEAQREFFEKGLPYLKPMILYDVAEAIGMHPATVSRVTARKYVQTPRGVFPLKYFFDGSTDTVDGTELATKAVKDRIVQLVREEDTHCPYSDQKIMDILQEQGVNIKRRTVAKYRDQLNILPARYRKRV